MGKELIFLVEEAPEGGYTTHALGYSIFAEAETVEQLRSEVVDAVRCHFDEAERPKVATLHFVRDEVLTV